VGVGGLWGRGVVHLYNAINFYLDSAGAISLTLSLTGVGPFGPSLTNMQIALKVLKVRYRQKIGIPQAGS
jgi:hypothetical protein